MKNKFLEFVRTINSPITLALIASNLLVYFLQLANGVSGLSPSPSELLAWGGNMAALSLTGEAWRLLTSVFVHAGLLHLLMNSYMLYLVGEKAEHLYGKFSVLLMYLAGGVLAGLASAVWQSSRIEKIRHVPTLFGLQESVIFEHVVTVGASGAIMAIAGALLVKMLAGQAQQQPDQNLPVDNSFRNALIQIVAINLVMGFMIKEIDQAAHVGGLIAGALMAGAILLLSKRPELRSAAPAVVTAVAVGIAVLVIRAAGNDEKLLGYKERIESEKRAAEKAVIAKNNTQLAAEAYRTAVKNLPVPVLHKVAQGRVLTFGGCTNAMSISEDEKYAYVVDSLQNRLIAVNLDTGGVQHTVQGPKAVEVKRMQQQGASCAGSGASSLVVLPDRQVALVPSMYPDTVAVIDLTSWALKRKLPVGRGPHEIVISNDKKRAYVSNASSNTVSVIDLDQWQVFHTLQLKADSSAKEVTSSMWLSADDATLFYFNRDTLNFDGYDTRTFKYSKTVESSGFIYSVKDHATSKDIKYVLKLDFLYTVISDSVQPKESWGLCPSTAADSFDVYPGKDGLELLATAHARDKDFYHAKIADLNSLATLGTYPMPSEPVQVKFSKDGKKLFALGRGGTISIVDPQKRVRTESKDLSLCIPPEYTTGDEVTEDYGNDRYEIETNALRTAFDAALADSNSLQTFMEVSQKIAAASPYVERYAFQLADHSTKLLINRIEKRDYKSAEEIVRHYVNNILPHAGADEKTADVASNALVLSVVTQNDAVADTTFKKLLGPDFDITSEKNNILLYNLACYYAVHKDKENMIKAIRQAVSRGKTAAQFMADSDFKDYLDDVDFQNALTAPKGRSQ